MFIRLIPVDQRANRAGDVDTALPLEGGRAGPREEEEERGWMEGEKRNKKKENCS